LDFLIKVKAFEFDEKAEEILIKVHISSID